MNKLGERAQMSAARRRHMAGKKIKLTLSAKTVGVTGYASNPVTPLWGRGNLTLP